MPNVRCGSYNIHIPGGHFIPVWGMKEFDEAIIEFAALCLYTEKFVYDANSAAFMGDNTLPSEFPGTVADLIAPEPKDYENLLVLCIFNEAFLTTAPKADNNGNAPNINIHKNVYQYVIAHIETHWTSIVEKATTLLNTPAS